MGIAISHLSESVLETSPVAQFFTVADEIHAVVKFRGKSRRTQQIQELLGHPIMSVCPVSIDSNWQY